MRCREITSLVLARLARLLGLREGYFVDMFDEDATTYARFNYYPRCLRPEDVLGLKPHSDGSVITVVSVDDTVSGLQVLRQGVWYDVPVVPNALLINMGDGMEVYIHLLHPFHNVKLSSIAHIYLDICMYLDSLTSICMWAMLESLTL